jgi:taurine dioxygenase
MRIERDRSGGLGVTVTEFRGQAATDDDARRLVGLVHEHALVVLRGQTFSTREYVEFARRLGPLDVYLQDNYHHPEFREIFVSSNEVVDGKPVGVARTGNYWHTDGAFLPRPYPLTMLYPQRLPATARETLFVDMGAVWQALPDDLRAAVAGTRAVHDGKWRYKVGAADAGASIAEILERITAACPPATHPTVITHPVTGREILYVSPGFTTHLAGVPHERSQAVLQAVFHFATRRERVHAHAYAPGDVIVWDNRQLIHRSGAVPPGEVSTIYRVNPNDRAPFYAPRPEAA